MTLLFMFSYLWCLHISTLVNEHIYIQCCDSFTVSPDPQMSNRSTLLSPSLLSDLDGLSLSSTPSDIQVWMIWLMCLLKCVPFSIWARPPFFVHLPVQPSLALSCDHPVSKSSSFSSNMFISMPWHAVAYSDILILDTHHKEGVSGLMTHREMTPLIRERQFG